MTNRSFSTISNETNKNNPNHNISIEKNRTYPHLLLRSNESPSTFLLFTLLILNSMDQLSTEQQLLIQERQLSSFPVKELMEYIYGGAQQVQRIEKVRKIIEENESMSHYSSLNLFF